MADGNATKRQLWALFCMTKVKTQNMVIGFEKAKDLISRGNSGKDITQELIDLGGVAPTSPKQDFEKLVEEANKAGLAAVEKLQVVPMVVTQRENPLDDNSAVVKQYYVPSGSCGFSSIRFPGNTAFGKWAKKEGIATKSYTGGLYIYVSGFGQSYQMKDCYAQAFSEVLNKNGVKAYVESRLD